jgi:hypothetical protein
MSAATDSQKESTPSTDGYNRVVQRGPLRIPVIAGRVILSAGEEACSARVDLSDWKHHFRGPFFTRSFPAVGRRAL